jgi:O-6-methylguanine DNA methyltransferase
MVDAALHAVCGPAYSLEKSAAPHGVVSTATKPKRANSEQLAALQVDLRGTAFQLRVWQALRQIPRGETRSYSQLAREMGAPNSTRAVARACAMNRVALVVPCHRVVGASGALTGYRWGVERKRMLLEARKVAVPGRPARECNPANYQSDSVLKQMFLQMVNSPEYSNS